ncbi:unnamed protein product [Dovyalis caffra]|uniref:PAR1 protein n=1 Tax=Dovyalis caffra TaxID=77055 RepID=A0AAV1RKW3_9ROSI|nr:unnamed protein product [Dovyalis caffra]
MVSSFKILSILALALALAICVQGNLGEITCERLDQDTCAYAISSSGKRCLLEKRIKRTGEEGYTCRMSEIEADRLRNWIETDQCIKACGLDRKSLGISSDSLLESRFSQQLCSPQCHDNCPNVVDLYFNLAAAEGVFLPKLCEAQEGNIRRGLMADIKSSGFVAPETMQPEKYPYASGEIICERLDQDTCAYAISSSGKRCLLEKRIKRTGEEAYTCRTSEIEADRLKNWIEKDQCIKACGLDRKSLGISSDSLLESRFSQQLCSPQCYHSCPNVVDLYFNLAAAEGVFLPKLCEVHEGNVRRGLMADIKSSGYVAPGPDHPVKYTYAPGPAEPVTYTYAPAPTTPPYY